MKRTLKLAAAAGVLALGTAGLGAAAVGAVSNEGRDKPIAGTALDQAGTAAISSTGGGRVTGTEVGDEESYYEVEITRADGSQVDVQLDRGFHVVSSAGDRDARRSGKQG